MIVHHNEDDACDGKDDGNSDSNTTKPMKTRASFRDHERQKTAARYVCVTIYMVSDTNCGDNAVACNSGNKDENDDVDDVDDVDNCDNVEDGDQSDSRPPVR